MKLLIDANILLDVLQNRENFVRASSMVWKLCETEQAKGYISALTFANLVYIMRKEMDAQRIEEVLHGQTPYSRITLSMVLVWKSVRRYFVSRQSLLQRSAQHLTRQALS